MWVPMDVRSRRPSSLLDFRSREYRLDTAKVQHNCLSRCRGRHALRFVERRHIAPWKTAPVERKAAANKPFAKIGAAGRTGRDRSSVLIQVHGQAVDGTPCDEGIEIIRGLRA